MNSYTIDLRKNAEHRHTMAHSNGLSRGLLAIFPQSLHPIISSQFALRSFDSETKCTELINNSLVFVARGTLIETIDCDTSLHRPIDIHTEGSWLGTVGLFNKQPFNSAFLTTEDTDLYVLSVNNPALQQCLTNPHSLPMLAKHIAQRQQFSLTKSLIASSLQNEQKLITYLACHRYYHNIYDRESSVKIKASQQLISKAIGISRSTASTTLAHLSRAALVTQGYRELHILPSEYWQLVMDSVHLGRRLPDQHDLMARCGNPNRQHIAARHAQ